MSAMPPRPWWMLIGPGLAAVIGLFLLTAVYGTGGVAPVQMDLGLSSQAMLLTCVVAYLVAAAVGFPVGLLLGRHYPTAVTVPAVCLMLIGVLLVAFTGAVGLLTVGRVLTGLGAGAVAGVVAALARGVAALVVAAAGVLAAVAGPFVNQAFSQLASFRVTFMAVEPFLFVALIASVVCGIALLAMTKRPAQSGPYGTPHPSAGRGG